MARFNRPSIMVYGGTIKPGCSKIDGRDLLVSHTFEAYGGPLLSKSDYSWTDSQSLLVCGVTVDTMHSCDRRMHKVSLSVLRLKWMLSQCCSINDISMPANTLGNDMQQQPL